MDKKSKTVASLKRTNDKLHRNNDILNKLNVKWQEQWQQKNETCQCAVTNLHSQVDDVDECSEPFRFTAEQKLLLARFVLPEDINKYVGEMATFLFTEDELKSVTAANLDSMKVAFMTRKFRTFCANLFLVLIL